MPNFLCLYSSVRSGGENRAKPPTILLVVVNLVIFVGLALYGVDSAVSLFVTMMVIPVFCVWSGVVQVLVRRVMERRHFLRPWYRVAAYLFPLWGWVVLGAITPTPPPLPNQISPTVSPSGLYEARMSTDKVHWIIEFKSLKDGQQWVCKTPLYSHFNAYWAWGADDHFWTYNGDSALVDYWEKEEAGWKRVYWGYPKMKNPPKEPVPPEVLWPRSAR